jgi:cytochrome c peroxidase
MKRSSLLAAPALAAVVAMTMSSPAMAQASSVAVEKRPSYDRPAAPAAPADNAMTSERVALGQKLFFDPRLSGSGWVSCATCHNPALGWADGLPLAVGEGMKKLKRHTPTILNAAYNKLQMWDGRFASLEEQALGPITNPDEMNMDMQELLPRLKAIAGYRPLFDAAYPGEGITPASIAKAIASYERTIVSGEAPFDRWRKGDGEALGAAARRGFELFEGKANCVACHQGHNFTDDGFHNIGVKPLAGFDDPGRFAKVPVKMMRGAHKTPSLRDVAYTAPYMHNGAYATLRDVVEMYNRGGDAGEPVDPNMKKLGLTPAEVDDVVAFLQGLAGKPVTATLPLLPN